VEDAFKASDFDYVATNGTVSRIRRDEGGPMWVQHNAQINHGNSGGPLLSEDGVVVGVNTLSVTEDGAQGIFYALATPQLRREIDAAAPGVAWRPGRP